MTEAEWLEAKYPHEMLAFIRERAGIRKLRLFGCACVRRVSHLLTLKYALKALEAAENYAEGTITRQKCYAASNKVWDADAHAVEPANFAIWAATSISRAVGDTVGGNACILEAAAQARRVDREIETMKQSDLLRDIFGNPFRPVTVDPAWLTSTAVSLAQGIYDERDFDRLPILADALEDAGCTNADILNHCRQPGEHVRGCWAVDLVLAKS